MHAGWEKRGVLGIARVEEGAGVEEAEMKVVRGQEPAHKGSYPPRESWDFIPHITWS